jgi:hemolysin activation/secretion protein
MNKLPAVKYKYPSLRIAAPLLAALLIAALPQTAKAAPDAGSLLQQIERTGPSPPPPSGTGLRFEQQGNTKLPISKPFAVKTIRITGNTQFDTATLHALVANEEGKNLTFADLSELAARIADYYHSHGYLFVQAVIPAQVIKHGVVTIEVIEARYGKITLDNRSRVSDLLLQDTLSPLQSGQAIGQVGLDRALLLLSDIPGVAINATLKPGETVGTSDLLVDTAVGPNVSGSVALDNYGNRYTGRARIGGTVNFINPLQHGDVFSVSGLSSGSDLNYGRVAYDSLLNGQGTRVGGSYSTLGYTLGDTLASLDAHGTAQVESLWAKHPLMRSRDANLYGQIQYDRLQLSDHIDASAIETDRHLENWTTSLAGDARDALLPNSTNTWNLSWTAGRVGFDNETARLVDAATAGTQGGFMRWTANFTHLQSLSPTDELYFDVSGQWTNGNLDPSMKMIAGGPYSVRAYDIAAVSGDSGYQGTAEFRHDLGAAWNGQWQAVAFIDSAYVTVNQSSWAAGANSATLNGAGVGINWRSVNQWSARAYIAMPIGPVPDLVGSTSSVRAWVGVSMLF